MANHSTVADQNTILSFRIFLSLRQHSFAVRGCGEKIHAMSNTAIGRRIRD
jgi:hypothetical protein